MRRVLAGQTGAIGAMAAVILMVVSLPIVLGALSLASTLGVDSRLKTERLKSQYAAMAGEQYAVYLLAHEVGYAEGLETGVPSTSTVNVNGRDITVSITKIINPNFTPPPPNSDNSRRLQVTKVVNPAVAFPNVQTTFTYTITVENRDDTTSNLTHIHDTLPAGFTYVTGSTISVFGYNSDPTVSGQTLDWNLNGLHHELASGESITLEFQASAALGEGVYCNEAWATPGDKKTSTGKTARVTVGSPAATLCDGAAVELTKAVNPGVVAGNTLTTYTYTLTLESIGTSTVDGSLIRDLLPAGFTYVDGSTSGLTTADPTVSVPGDTSPRNRLDWTFNFTLQSGETRTLSFQATANLDPGEYYNEAWVTASQFADTLYTWPTALVNVMGAFTAEASDGTSTVSGNIWVGADGSYVVGDWTIE